MKTTFLSLLLALFGLASRPAAAQLKAALTGNVLSVSDIHFDIPSGMDAKFENSNNSFTYLDNQLKADTDEKEPARNRTNYWLLESTLTQMQAQLANPDFIVITGDLLAHRFSKHVVDSTTSGFYLLRRVNEYLVWKLQHRFPGTVVLAGLGNNDNDRKDDNPASHAFRKMFAETWAPLMYTTAADRAAFVKEFEVAGYYRYELGKGRRLLMLNSVLFMTQAGYSGKKKGLAEKQLAWLQSQLLAATAAHEQLWLAMHVPYGISARSTVDKCPTCLTSGKLGTGYVASNWVGAATDAFVGYLAAYPDPVRLSLAGHIHMDEFRLLTNKSDHDKVVGFLHLTASVSPAFGNNPTFQTLTYDPASLALLNDATYYLSLSQYFATKKKSWPKWHLEYVFDKTYGVSAINAATLQTVWTTLGPFGQPPQISYARYYKGSISTLYDDNSPVNKTQWLYYWSTAGKTTSSAYCQSLYYWETTYGPSAAHPARPLARTRPANAHPTRVRPRPVVGR